MDREVQHCIWWRIAIQPQPCNMYYCINNVNITIQYCSFWWHQNQVYRWNIFWVTGIFVELLSEINRPELVISGYVFLIRCISVTLFCWLWWVCWLISERKQECVSIASINSVVKYAVGVYLPIFIKFVLQSSIRYIFSSIFRLIRSHNFVSNTIESVDVSIGLSKTIVATKAKSPHAVYA